MKTHLLFIFCTMLSVSYQAQRDTSAKIQLMGFQIDIRPGHYPKFAQQTQSDYQKFVKHDDLLNRQLPENIAGGQTLFNYFSAILGISAYAKLKTKRNINIEVFTGVRYGHEHNGGVEYAGGTRDTIDSYYNSQSEVAFYQLRTKSSNYHFIPKAYIF
jgi:hypothetical protein